MTNPTPRTRQNQSGSTSNTSQELVDQSLYVDPEETQPTELRDPGESHENDEFDVPDLLEEELQQLDEAASQATAIHQQQYQQQWQTHDPRFRGGLPLYPQGPFPSAAPFLYNNDPSGPSQSSSVNPQPTFAYSPYAHLGHWSQPTRPLGRPQRVHQDFVDVEVPLNDEEHKTPAASPVPSARSERTNGQQDAASPVPPRRTEPPQRRKVPLPHGSAPPNTIPTYSSMPPYGYPYFGMPGPHYYPPFLPPPHFPPHHAVDPAVLRKKQLGDALLEKIKNGYSGQADKPHVLHQYCKWVDAAISYGSLTEQEAVLYVSLFFDKDAKIWWEGLTPDTKESLTTWNTFTDAKGIHYAGLKDELNKQFISKLVPSDAWVKWVNMKWTNYSTFASFNSQFVQYCQLHKTPPTSWQKTQHYRSLLPITFKNAIDARLEGDETFEQYLEMAQTLYPDWISQHKLSSKPSAHAAAMQEKTQPVSSPVDSSRKPSGKPDTVSTPVPPQPSGGDKKPRCYCGRTDHLVSACPQIQNLKNLANKWKQHEKNTKPRSPTTKTDTSTSSTASNAVAFHATSESMDVEIMIDSGCSDHCTSNPDLIDYNSITPCSRSLRVANDASLSVPYQGTINITTSDAQQPLTLNNVLVSPELNCSLLSVAKANDSNIDVLFKASDRKVYFTQDGKHVASGYRKGDLFYLSGKVHADVTIISHDNATAFATQETLSYSIAHARLGHPGKHVFNKLSEVVDGWNTHTPEDTCDSCIRGKFKRLPFPPSVTPPAPIGTYVHTDVQGPFRWPGLKAERYCCSFIDDGSRYALTFAIPDRKSKTILNLWKQVQPFLERRTNQKVLTIRMDGGGEYQKDFKAELTRSGITTHVTNSYSSQQNGVAERFNLTILDRVRAILIDTGLPRNLWSELVTTVTYLHNLLPNTHSPSTPHFVLHQTRPNLSHLRALGCLAYAGVPSKGRDKLGTRATRTYLVGYGHPTGTKGWRLWNPITQTIITSRDVQFHESEGLPSNLRTQPDSLDMLDDEDIDEIQWMPNDDNWIQHIQDERTDSHGNKEYLVKFRGFRNPTWQSASLLNESEAVDRWEAQAFALAASAHAAPLNDDALSWNQAMASNDRDEYYLAAQKEFDALKLNNTFTYVRRPTHQKVVGSTWVFRIKYDAEGNPIKHKARACVRGDSQKYGIDYEETYSPTVPSSIIRMFLVLAAKYNWSVETMDAVNAFLNSLPDRPIYVEQFQGFADPDHPRAEWVMLLNKALYGLKQAPLLWFQTQATKLEELGFHPCPHQPCVFLKRLPVPQDADADTVLANTVFIIVYVDDYIITAPNDDIMTTIKEELHSAFKMTENGPIRSHLGVLISRTVLPNGKICFEISNQHYIEKMLISHGLDKCTPTATPLRQNYLSEPTHTSPPLPDIQTYQRIVGELMWCMLTWRPDIAVAVNLLARNMSSPTERDLTDAKHLLRYLKGTITRTLRITGDTSDSGLRIYSDSDWAGDHKDRKSISGCAVFFHGCLVDWHTRKQSCVALSSVEAEYIAAATAGRDTLWYRRVISWIQGVPTLDPTPFHMDNQSAATLATNNNVSQRTKHIDVRYHAIRDWVHNKELALVDTDTKHNLADFFTKPMNAELHKSFVNIIFNLTGAPVPPSRSISASINLVYSLPTLPPTLPASEPSLQWPPPNLDSALPFPAWQRSQPLERLPPSPFVWLLPHVDHPTFAYSQKPLGTRPPAHLVGRLPLEHPGQRHHRLAYPGAPSPSDPYAGPKCLCTSSTCVAASVHPPSDPRSPLASSPPPPAPYCANVDTRPANTVAQPPQSALPSASPPSIHSRLRIGPSPTTPHGLPNALPQPWSPAAPSRAAGVSMTTFPTYAMLPPSLPRPSLVPCSTLAHV